VAIAMMLVVFSYSGFDRLGYAAGEMRRPKKVIPLSMGLGLVVIISCYVLANVIYHTVLGMDGVRATSAVAWDTADQLLGPAAALLVAAVVIVSVTGSINGTIMTSTRAYFSMARDGLFIQWLNHIHPRFRTPSRAIVAHVIWASVIVAVRVEFAAIVSGMAFIVLIFYAMSTGAMMKMRMNGVGDEGAYRTPWFPVLPIFYLAGIILLIALRAWFDPRNTLLDLSFVAMGLPFAFYFCRGNRRSG
jgi:APA family basic amino acid/polyamine antiporter